MESTYSQEQAIDRQRAILPETLGLAAFIAPFLVLAFLILFITPDQTDDRFAWGIGPQMTAMMLGATYMTGAFFFVTVLLVRDWHQVRLGFLPVTTFATTLGIATLLHWDAFNHDHVAFWLWVGLYFTTPFLVFLVWLRNQRTISDRPRTGDDLIFPRVVRFALGAIGAVGIVAYLLLFFAPSLMIDNWPWTISELTSRVLAAQLAVYTVFALGMLNDPRWSSARVLLRAQLPTPILFLIATFASWPDFDTGNPLTWAFVFNVAVVFVIGVPALYFVMESRRTRIAAQPAGSVSAQ